MTQKPQVMKLDPCGKIVYEMKAHFIIEQLIGGRYTSATDLSAFFY